MCALDTASTMLTPRVSSRRTELTTESPLWVGAWWVGFLGTGAAAFLIAVPILGYPRQLPGGCFPQKDTHALLLLPARSGGAGIVILWAGAAIWQGGPACVLPPPLRPLPAGGPRKRLVSTGDGHSFQYLPSPSGPRLGPWALSHLPIPATRHHGASVRDVCLGALVHRLVPHPGGGA